MEKTVALHTLGCRLNFSETGSISQGFVKRGYKVLPFGEEADVTFINTCTVTDNADSSCRQLIKKAHKASPDGKVVVAGCYAQMDSEKISKMQGVDLVLGTTEKYKVFDYLDEEQSETVFINKSSEFLGAATSVEDFHTRAFLKIQDGCNYVCSFCIIPQARGRSRTITVKDAIQNAKDVIASGFKEIVLTGVNIGEYESSSGEKLADMLKGILELDGLERLRLSSVEPNTMTDEILDLLASSPKFMNHFHIPLQSGNNRILKDMRRKYDVSTYREVIGKIIKRFPDAGIGADMIVGFPGETEEEFLSTLNLARELPLTHFHVFPYSKRKGTIAGRMEDHIQHPEKKRRSEMLRMLGSAKLNQFREDQIGQVNDVLFERRNKKGLWEGYTTNYVRVYVNSPLELKNKIVKTLLSKVEDEKLIGELL